MGVANLICKLRGHSKINNFVAVGSRKPALLITCHCVPVSIQAGEAGDARVTMLIFFGIGLEQIQLDIYVALDKELFIESLIEE